MPVSNLFFLISIATLPIQLNKYFFLEHSYVLGIPIDYRAPVIYLSDIFILLTIIFTPLNHGKKLIAFTKKNLALISLFTATFAYITLNDLITSTDKRASLYFDLRIFEMTLYVFTSVFFLTQNGIKNIVQKVLIFSIVWQSLAAIMQFIFQRAIGLYFLGERSFDVGTSQIAQVNLFGSELLRAYGTFPHPNVLAAFLLISAAAADININLGDKNTRSFAYLVKNNWIIAVLALGLLATFSKTALLLSAVFICLSAKKLNHKLIAISLSLCAFMLYFKFFTQTYIETMAERVMLTQAALDMSLKNLITGIGSNNFIVHLASLNLISIGQVRLLQPVHNVFLLIIAENGLIALFLVFAMLLYIIQKTTARSLFITTAVLAYMSVDHFLWTLHQGQMLFFLSLALIYSSKKKG